jgi:hypothetical protein
VQQWTFIETGVKRIAEIKIRQENAEYWTDRFLRFDARLKPLGEAGVTRNLAHLGSQEPVDQN